MEVVSNLGKVEDRAELDRKKEPNESRSRRGVSKLGGGSMEYKREDETSRFSAIRDDQNN